MLTASAILEQLSSDRIFRLTEQNPHEPAVQAIAVIETASDARRCAPGSLVIVSRALSRELSGFELDTMMRQAIDRASAGLIFHDLRSLPLTVHSLALRSGLPVFAYTGEGSIVDLVHRLDAVMGAGEASAIDRATAALKAVRGAAEHTDTGEVIASASASLGLPLTLEWLSPRPPGSEPVFVSGLECGWLAAPTAIDPAATVALPALAAEIGRRYEARLDGEEFLGNELARLFDSNDSVREHIAEDLRSHGMRVDSRHVVGCLTVAEAQRRSDDPLSRPRRLTTAATLASRVLRRRSGRAWLVTHIEDMVTLVWSGVPTDEDVVKIATSDLSELIEMLSRSFPGSSLRAGLGMPGSGVDGLVAAGAQARSSAQQAANSRARGAVVPTTASPVEQLLQPALGSAYAMSLVHVLLAPIDALPENAQLPLVLTLATYLDHQGSNTRAASRLHLHPNAVGYRIKKATSVLGADLSDAETRRALHLAAQLWLMENGQPPQALP